MPTFPQALVTVVERARTYLQLDAAVGSLTFAEERDPSFTAANAERLDVTLAQREAVAKALLSDFTQLARDFGPRWQRYREASTARLRALAAAKDSSRFKPAAALYAYERWLAGDVVDALPRAFAEATTTLLPPAASEPP